MTSSGASSPKHKSRESSKSHNFAASESLSASKARESSSTSPPPTTTAATSASSTGISATAASSTTATTTAESQDYVYLAQNSYPNSQSNGATIAPGIDPEIVREEEEQHARNVAEAVAEAEAEAEAAAAAARVVTAVTEGGAPVSVAEVEAAAAAAMGMESENASGPRNDLRALQLAVSLVKERKASGADAISSSTSGASANSTSAATTSSTFESSAATGSIDSASSTNAPADAAVKDLQAQIEEILARNSGAISGDSDGSRSFEKKNLDNAQVQAAFNRIYVEPLSRPQAAGSSGATAGPTAATASNDSTTGTGEAATVATSSAAPAGTSSAPSTTAEGQSGPAQGSFYYDPFRPSGGAGGSYLSAADAAVVAAAATLENGIQGYPPLLSGEPKITSEAIEQTPEPLHHHHYQHLTHQSPDQAGPGPMTQQREAATDDSMAVISMSPGAGSGKRRMRHKWTPQETESLIKGCEQYGVGNWKKIIMDPKYQFNGRTAVDLKDRFRTSFPEEYARLYPNAKTHKSSKNHQTPGDNILQEVNETLEKTKRKERRSFTPEEDRNLLEGYKVHAASWSKIQRDKTYNLTERRSTDLRDRFRNAFPAIYADAGFKGRLSGGIVLPDDPNGDGYVTAAAIDQAITTGMTPAAALSMAAAGAAASHSSRFGHQNRPQHLIQLEQEYFMEKYKRVIEKQHGHHLQPQHHQAQQQQENYDYNNIDIQTASEEPPQQESAGNLSPTLKAAAEAFAQSNLLNHPGAGRESSVHAHHTHHPEIDDSLQKKDSDEAGPSDHVADGAIDDAEAAETGVSAVADAAEQHQLLHHHYHGVEEEEEDGATQEEVMASIKLDAMAANGELGEDEREEDAPEAAAAAAATAGGEYSRTDESRDDGDDQGKEDGGRTKKGSGSRLAARAASSSKSGRSEAGNTSRSAAKHGDVGESDDEAALMASRKRGPEEHGDDVDSDGTASEVEERPSKRTRSGDL